MVLKLPDVEAASAKCQRSCQRLEKAIATYHATGERPVHIVGRGRISLLGVELIPLECATPSCCRLDDEEMSDHYRDMEEDDEADMSDKPPRGTRVDSISYYTQELAAHSRVLARLQQKKSSLAETGNHSLQAGGWLNKIVKEATIIGNAIMKDSIHDNHLESSSANLHYRQRKNSYPQAENMTSQYGSITPTESQRFPADLREFPKQRDGLSVRWKTSLLIPLTTVFQTSADYDDDYVTPFSRSQYTSRARRWASRMGLDYLVGFMRLLHKQIDVVLQGVVPNTMSSSGFVTFLDLTSTCCAATAPLTVKSSVLHVTMAPEPRVCFATSDYLFTSLIDVFVGYHLGELQCLQDSSRTPRAVCERCSFSWRRALEFSFSCNPSFCQSRISFTNSSKSFSFCIDSCSLFDMIQAFRWILYINGGKYTSLINGYLPVVALLCLILILPAIFLIVALKYERRKTKSDVQASMLGRYFYYQLATIYITVTAVCIRW